MKRGLVTLWIAVAIVALGAASPPVASAWTADTRVEMAEYARGIAPPDLGRQLERHKKRYREGARADLDPRASYDEIEISVRARVDRSVAMIEAHRPFAELAEELGRLGREVAELNDPLRAPASDPAGGRYAADWARYARSAKARFSVLFYGGGRDLRSERQVDALLERTRERALELHPLVLREYRRIPVPDGRKHFDDRSTAFGTAALAFSHGVSDHAALLRYIWLRAGGIDERDYLPFDADRAVLLAPNPQSP